MRSHARGTGVAPSPSRNVREKKQEKEEKDEQYYRMERSYGAFARTVRLAVPVEGGKGTTIPIKPE